MSWNTIAPEPASCVWIKTADPEQVQYHWYLQACQDWIDWQREVGVIQETQIPAMFVAPGDLQSFSNVVSWWPKNAPPTYHAPNLSMFFHDLPIKDGRAMLFSERLDYLVNRVKGWIATKGGDAENPNETREERAARKNRERQRNYKLRHAGSSDDPALHALLVTARQEAETLSVARAWLKGEIAEAKGAEQAAIAAAKGARAERVAIAEKHVADQEKRMLDAKSIVDHYKSNT